MCFAPQKYNDARYSIANNGIKKNKRKARMPAVCTFFTSFATDTIFLSLLFSNERFISHFHSFRGPSSFSFSSDFYSPPGAARQRSRKTIIFAVVENAGCVRARFQWICSSGNHTDDVKIRRKDPTWKKRLKNKRKVRT